MTSSKVGSRPGFSLPAVLAVTGVVTLIFLVAISALASLNTEARSARQRVEFLQRAMSAEATLSYIAATEPFTQASLLIGGPRNINDYGGGGGLQFSSGLDRGEIALDGTLYRFPQEDGVLASLQDQAGMINIAKLDPQGFARLSTAIDALPSARPLLMARYLDYVDANNLTRLDGAEQSAYGGNGPANRPMMRPQELLSVLGVRDSVDPSLWRAIASDLAMDTTEATRNLNTANDRTLQIRYGLTPQQSSAAIKRRQQLPFNSVLEFNDFVGGSIFANPEEIYTYPSGRIIFTIEDTKSPWKYRGRIALTPGGMIQPVWIDQTEMFESGNRKKNSSADAPRFPYPAY